MATYIKTDTKEVVEAYKSDAHWSITHADGDVTYLTDQKFKKRYELKVSSPAPIKVKEKE